MSSFQGNIISSIFRRFEASEMMIMSGQSMLLKCALGSLAALQDHPAATSQCLCGGGLVICEHARGVLKGFTRWIAFFRAWRCLLVLMAEAKLSATALTTWSWHQWQWPSAGASGQLLRRSSKVSCSYPDVKDCWPWRGIINSSCSLLIITSQSCQHILHIKPWHFTPSKTMIRIKQWNNEIPCASLCQMRCSLSCWHDRMT